MYTRRTSTLIASAAALILATVATVGAQKHGADFAKEPACQTLTPASMGGPAPKDKDVMVWRWFGASNHELDYRNQVILINAFYQRTPPARPLGFTRDDIKKADAIYVGHAHSDVDGVGFPEVVPREAERPR